MGSIDFAGPFTAAGELRDRIESVRRELHQKAGSCEINSVRRIVDNAIDQIRTLDSALDGYQQRLCNLEENYRELQARFETFMLNGEREQK